MSIMVKTPIELLGMYENNNLYMKRDDLITYSFGGNKVRKALLFFKQIDSGGFDCVVTYGSSHSNHCRVIANMAAARNIKCYIIAPEEVSDKTFNSKFMELFGAEITTVPVACVHDVIEEKIQQLRNEGFNPYFIPGGGHGNLGTQAYVDCYLEIKDYEQKYKVHFDYIFFASGTGTTHSGLVCGQLMNNEERDIVGISIARKNPRGRSIVVESISDYLHANDIRISKEQVAEKTIFIDDYIGNGYGKDNNEVIEIIKSVMIKYGVPLDSTYTGKAFLGMKKYIMKQQIEGKNILFIHTGGTPLFFDDVERL